MDAGESFRIRYQYLFRLGQVFPDLNFYQMAIHSVVMTEPAYSLRMTKEPDSCRLFYFPLQ